MSFITNADRNTMLHLRSALENIDNDSKCNLYIKTHFKNQYRSLSDRELTELFLILTVHSHAVLLAFILSAPDSLTDFINNVMLCACKILEQRFY